MGGADRSILRQKLHLFTQLLDLFGQLGGFPPGIATAQFLAPQPGIDAEAQHQHAAAGHITFATDAQLGPWALVMLGGEFKSPTI